MAIKLPLKLTKKQPNSQKVDLDLDNQFRLLHKNSTVQRMISGTSPVSLNDVSVLQNTIGNQAVQRLLHDTGRRHKTSEGNDGEHALGVAHNNLLSTVQRHPFSPNQDIETADKDSGHELGKVSEIKKDRMHKNISPKLSTARSNSNCSVVQRYTTIPEDLVGGEREQAVNARTEQQRRQAGWSEPPANYKITLASDKEAESIGHSWVIFERPNGTKASYGFWPEGNFTILGKMAAGWTSGSVMHPDEMHTADSTYTVDTTKEKILRGVSYARRNWNANYHLLFYNCSTFARKMFEMGAGQAAPSGGLIIDSPNELADKIREENSKHGKDNLGKPSKK